MAWAANLGTVDLPPVAVALRGHRPPGRAAHRPGPAAGDRLRRRPGRGAARWCGRCWTSWGGSASRRPAATAACTCTCGSSRGGGSSTCGTPSIALAREVERSGAGAGDDRVVEGGARRAGVHRLQPDRAGPHDRERRTASASGSTGDVSTPLRWDELADVHPDDFTIATVPARFAELGDVHAAIDDVAHDLTPLLEWYARDERDRGWATCRTRRATRRCRASRCGSSPAGRSADASSPECGALGQVRPHTGSRLRSRSRWYPTSVNGDEPRLAASIGAGWPAVTW